MSKRHDKPPRSRQVVSTPAQLTIERLVEGGFGLARTTQGIVFVSGVLPEETVHARLEGFRGGVPLFATDLIASPSPDRHESPCPLVGICGGCDWLHIRSEAQPLLKRDIFIDSMKRIGKITITPAQCEVAASSSLYYRLRAQFKIDAKMKRVGFFKHCSQDIVPVSHCPVLVPQLNQLLEHQERWISHVLGKYDQIKAIAGDSGIASLPTIPHHTHERTAVNVGTASFRVDGGGFFQSNRYLLERLGTWALPWVGGDYLIDLFGGVGFFSVMLGQAFARGHVVDSIESLTCSALQNLKTNGLPNFGAVCSTADAFLRKMTAEKIRPDCLVVDPPRPGIERSTRELIGKLSPPVIVSISCNPATHARDAGYLISQCGYYLKRAAIFDLYPNTHHIESALILTKEA